MKESFSVRLVDAVLPFRAFASQMLELAFESPLIPWTWNDQHIHLPYLSFLLKLNAHVNHWNKQNRYRAKWLGWMNWEQKFNCNLYGTAQVGLHPGLLTCSFETSLIGLMPIHIRCVLWAVLPHFSVHLRTWIFINLIWECYFIPNVETYKNIIWKVMWSFI